jgi:hypothetical protein
MEDENEDRNSKSIELSLSSPKLTLDSLGDRISDLNLRDELPQIEILENSNSHQNQGSSENLSQASNTENIDENDRQHNAS